MPEHDLSLDDDLDALCLDDVCELLDACIDSLAGLEVLVLLHGEPARWWAVTELAHALDMRPDDARAAVQELSHRGLVVDALGGKVRFAPVADLAYDAFAALARAFRTQRVAIAAHVLARTMPRAAMGATASRGRRA